MPRVQWAVQFLRWLTRSICSARPSTSSRRAWSSCDRTCAGPPRRPLTLKSIAAFSHGSGSGLGLRRETVPAGRSIRAG
jgi:hypothetical protein